MKASFFTIIPQGAEERYDSNHTVRYNMVAMKLFHLIETTPNGLRAARSFLQEMNAESRTFASVREALAANEVPDMVVFLAPKDEAQYKADMKELSGTSWYGSVPRINVLPLALALHRRTAVMISGEKEFTLPLDKQKFLAEVTRCLHIPQRRTFQIIVSIQVPDSNIQFSGVSLDFSETGMGFESRAAFSVHQQMRISFVNPKTKARLRLQAEVARKAPAATADNFVYGVRFADLSRRDSDELKKFIGE